MRCVERGAGEAKEIHGVEGNGEGSNIKRHTNFTEIYT